MTSRRGWIVLRWVLVCVTLASIGFIVVNAQMTLAEWNDRRLSVLEQQKDIIVTNQSDLSGRVLVLESDMVELKWLSRTATVALVGQFASLLIRAIKRKQQDEERA